MPVVLTNLVKFQVQKEFTKDATTPAVLKANPFCHNVAALPPVRTVLAKVKITPEITVKIICIHQLIHEHLRNNLFTLSTLFVDGLLNSIGGEGSATPAVDLRNDRDTFPLVLLISIGFLIIKTG